MHIYIFLITGVLVLYFYGQEETKYYLEVHHEKVDEGNKRDLRLISGRINQFKNASMSVMECFS